MMCSRNPKQRNAPRASSAPRASKATSSRARHLHAQRNPRRVQVPRLGQRKPPLCAMQSPGSSQSFTHTRPSAPCASRTLRNRPNARRKGRNSINQPAACSSSRAERAAPSHLTRFQVARLRASRLCSGRGLRRLPERCLLSASPQRTSRPSWVS
jgi:hypothetical protein